MRVLEKTQRVTRRGFLKTSSVTAFGTVAIGYGGILLDPQGAWAMDLKTLKPQTMATMIQMARDIYPHDRLTDAAYAQAVGGYDETATTDPKTKQLIEGGVAMLNQHAQAAHKVNYVNVGWEEERVSILQLVEGTAFFTTVRAGLVTGLYNQPGIWQKFGYEGPSASKGGYLHRGFNDIDWLGTTASATPTGTTPVAGAKS